MMRRLLTPIALALPAIAFASPVQPGLWEMTSSVTAATMPGAPPAAIEKMKQPHVTRSCMTPEQAARGPADMSRANKSCKVLNHVDKGGVFDAQLICTQGAGSMTMHSRGTYTPTSFTTTADMVMAGPHPMKMSVASRGRRLGACP